MAEARDITELSLEELAQVERTEAELDSFLEKRAREAKDANKIEELWAKSEREHREKRREENRTLWIEFHSRLSRSHARISAEHEAKAQALLEQSEEKEGEMNNGIHKRLESLEVRTLRPRHPERSAHAREHMKKHLDQLAALRRGELSDEEAAEVMATHAAIEHRMREVRGEGNSYGGM